MSNAASPSKRSARTTPASVRIHMSEDMIAVITTEEPDVSTEDIWPWVPPNTPAVAQRNNPRETGSITARPSAFVRSISSLRMKFRRHATSPNLNQSHTVSRS